MLTAKKKLAELELSLGQLGQNFVIPKIVLKIHPVILEAIDMAQQRGRKPELDPVLANDPMLLNAIQNDVNTWVRDIRVITQLDRDPNQGSARQEIEFWVQLEVSIAHIEQELKTPEVNMALDLLRNAKRFHATVSFLADTGIKEATEKVLRYNQLMKEFPINDLLTASDLVTISNAIIAIFSHLNKKLRLSPYPIARALSFVSKISLDLNTQVLKALDGTKVISLPPTELKSVFLEAQLVFRTWDDNLKEFINVAREMTRKRSEKFIPIKILSNHAKLESRIDYIAKFRENHDQLIETLYNIQQSQLKVKTSLVADYQSLEELKNAMSAMEQFNALGTSDGKEYFQVRGIDGMGQS